MSTALRSFARIALMGLFIVLTTTAVLMAYVLVDDGYLRRMNTAPQPRHYTVATTTQNWTPPQPADETLSVLPAVQGFVAPEVWRRRTYGDADVRCGCGFRTNDADPFSPAAGTAAACPFGGDEPSAAVAIRRPVTFRFPAFGSRCSSIFVPGVGGRWMRPTRARCRSIHDGRHAARTGGHGTHRQRRRFAERGPLVYRVLGTGDEAFRNSQSDSREFAKPRVGPTYRASSGNR